MFDFNLVQNTLIPEYPEKSVLIIVLAFAACALIGYLLGSINFSIIISKLFYKDDIRAHGSGNAGSTNMLRTHGTVSGLVTFFCDGLKTAVAVIGGFLIFNYFGAYTAGFFCVIGHVFPLYHHFKGGKGVATVAFMMALTNWKTFLVCLVLFIVIVIITKYVSLGSIIGALMYPPVLYAVLLLFPSDPEEFIGVAYAVLIAIIVVVKHRSNIKKLRNNTESKIKFTKHGTDGADNGK